MVLVSVSDDCSNNRYKRKDGFLYSFGGLRDFRHGLWRGNRTGMPCSGDSDRADPFTGRQNNPGSHRSGGRVVFYSKCLVSECRRGMDASFRRTGGQLVLECRADFIQRLEGKKWRNYDSAFFGMYVACRNVDFAAGGGDPMAVCHNFKLQITGKNRKINKCSASITVEASYIMGMVILVMAVLIRTAYFQCQKTVETMRLHYIVECLRSREDKQIKILPHGQAERTLEQVEGYIDTGTWKKEITAGVYEPERILRNMAAFEKNGIQKDQKE